MKNIAAIGLSAFLLLVSTNSWSDGGSEKPPFQAGDIKIELGAFAPCLKLVPDGIEYFSVAGSLTIYMKQTLKKPIESCVGRGTPRAVIHDSAGNELLSQSLFLPEDVGTTNRKPLSINWIPSNVKPPVTVKVR
jgi:hypothetical protein